MDLSAMQLRFSPEIITSHSQPAHRTRSGRQLWLSVHYCAVCWDLRPTRHRTKLDLVHMFPRTGLSLRYVIFALGTLLSISTTPGHKRKSRSTSKAMETLNSSLLQPLVSGRTSPAPK